MNNLIREDLTVTEAYLSPDQAGQQVDLSRLPDNSGETVRIVHIGEYDCLLHFSEAIN